MKIQLLTIFFLVSGFSQLCSQDSQRFQKEIADITATDTNYRTKPIILFTGSSTIRMWKTLAADFPGYPVVNHGFGGSQMTDLLYFDDELILKYKPKQIFIYEGDNDIASSKSTDQIIKTADSLVSSIRKALPDVPLYFISAKPSKSRWQLKEKYLEYNTALKKFTASKKNLHYVDLWTPMLGTDGIVLQDIFIEDELHMNAKGYAIWKKTIGPYLK